MFKRILFVGLLALPGSFLVVGVACLHPGLRKEIMRMSGFSEPFMRFSRTFSRVWSVRAIRAVR